jgi:hypothetical protein
LGLHGGLFLAGFSPGFFPSDPSRDEKGGPMEPNTPQDLPAHLWALSPRQEEDGLGGVFGQVGPAQDAQAEVEDHPAILGIKASEGLLCPNPTHAFIPFASLIHALSFASPPYPSLSILLSASPYLVAFFLFLSLGGKEACSQRKDAKRRFLF